MIIAILFLIGFIYFWCFLVKEEYNSSIKECKNENLYIVNDEALAGIVFKALKENKIKTINSNSEEFVTTETVYKFLEKESIEISHQRVSYILNFLWDRNALLKAKIKNEIGKQVIGYRLNKEFMPSL